LAAGAALGLAWALVRAGLGAAVVDAVSADARGTALSFLYTCFDLGVGAGSFGLGIMAQAQGYGAAFRMTAGWAVVALIGYVAWDQRKG
jgi:predicted MFS family arabinose efflux permease